MTSPSSWRAPDELLDSRMLPSGPTFVTVKFELVTFAPNDRVDVPGLAVPSSGHAVTAPDAVGATAVIVNATADTFELGTPPRPSTGTAIWPPGATAPIGDPTPASVLSTRDGATALYEPGTEPGGTGAGGVADAGLPASTTPTVTRTTATTPNTYADNRRTDNVTPRYRRAGRPGAYRAAT